MFFLQQNQRTRGQNRFCPGLGGEGKGVQIMYTHVSECKNDKIKIKKKNKFMCFEEIKKR
jgi:hypothetical protein